LLPLSDFFKKLPSNRHILPFQKDGSWKKVGDSGGP
jgi:hypothetical protein